MWRAVRLAGAEAPRGSRVPLRGPQVLGGRRCIKKHYLGVEERVRELEDLLRKWEGELASARLSELLKLGRVVDDMGIRGLAARWGMDLPSYVMYASNFYDSWHDSVMKLMKLGVLSMDGEINYDLIRGRARAGCAGRGIHALRRGPGARASTAFLISPASRDITRFQS